MDIKSVRRILKEIKREAIYEGKQQELLHLGINIFCEPDGRIHGEDKRESKTFEGIETILEEIKIRRE